MWGFAWMFWLVPFLMFAMFARRCAGGGRWAHRDRDRAPRFDREPTERRADDTDVLERRIADLEERLDFTERLLAKRTESTA